MRRKKFSKHTWVAKSSYLCKCGEIGFVDLGEDAKNRYPCKTCYIKLRVPQKDS